MASVLDRIPAPSRQYERQAAAEPSAAERLAVRARKAPPPGGQRPGVVPRRLEDYGDGEAGPAQLPARLFAVMQAPAALQRP